MKKENKKMSELIKIKEDISEIVKECKRLHSENKRFLEIIEQKNDKINNLFKRIHFLEQQELNDVKNIFSKFEDK